MFMPQARFAQIVFNRGDKPIQTTFEDVVVGTLLHGVNDGLFIDLVGKQNERNINLKVMHQL